ncbi:hypothetical protein Psed_0870 [Pseudonocardia dioxanivorans CB1190]|uniref:Uncharacterized protein n=2 Tax=Pseudonocardia dioxanivorans TaxID=240495 RepID=F4CSF0_PSEUX|nr:hypothetical protein Psed_0870 [Pseudonocardia dioxanivorans CB1190]
MSRERSHDGDDPYGRLGGDTPYDDLPPDPGPDEWEPSPSLLGRMRSGSWLEDQVFPPLQYVVPDVIAEGTTVFAGAPKVGKSWAVLHIALSVAAGTRVFGCLPVGPGRPVLYLALEDGWRRLQSRSRSLLGNGRRIPWNLDILLEVEHQLAVETVAEWVEQHQNDRPTVIVDTLGKVMPSSRAGESAYERDYRAVGAFKRVIDAAPGAALILVHHTRKLGSDDFVDSVSGTLGVTGAADSTVVLARSRTDDGGLLKVTGRDIFEAEYAVEKNPSGLWTLTGGSLVEARKAATTARVSEGVSDRSADIIALVADSLDGIGPTAVGEKLGISTQQAGVYLSRLEKTGRLRKVGRGVYKSCDNTSTHSTLSTGVDRHGNAGHPRTTDDTVESVDSPGQTHAGVETEDGLPRQPHWSLPDSDASPATDVPRARDGGTTGTTGPDLHVSSGTTGTTEPVVPPHVHGTTGGATAPVHHITDHWRVSGEPA